MEEKVELAGEGRWSREEERNDRKKGRQRLRDEHIREEEKMRVINKERRAVMLCPCHI